MLRVPLEWLQVNSVLGEFDIEAVIIMKAMRWYCINKLENEFFNLNTAIAGIKFDQATGTFKALGGGSGGADSSEIEAATEGDPGYNTNYGSRNTVGAAGGKGELGKLLEELVKTAEYAARNPNDQNAKKRLLDILNNLPLDMLDSDGERLANLIRDLIFCCCNFSS